MINRQDPPATTVTSTNASTNVCKHGQLARVCELCEAADRIASLEAELVEALLHIESLQNRWANRPLSVEDTAALEAENKQLKAERDKYAQEFNTLTYELNRATKDAERYRWLRNWNTHGNAMVMVRRSWVEEATMDAAIDAERSPSSPPATATAATAPGIPSTPARQP